MRSLWYSSIGLDHCLTLNGTLGNNTTSDPPPRVWPTDSGTYLDYPEWFSARPPPCPPTRGRGSFYPSPCPVCHCTVDNNKKREMETYSGEMQNSCWEVEIQHFGRVDKRVIKRDRTIIKVCWNNYEFCGRATLYIKYMYCWRNSQYRPGVDRNSVLKH